MKYYDHVPRAQLGRKEAVYTDDAGCFFVKRSDGKGESMSPKRTNIYLEENQSSPLVALRDCLIDYPGGPADREAHENWMKDLREILDALDGHLSRERVAAGTERSREGE